MALTLGNPITPAASAAITMNNHNVNLAGKSLSTGIDENNDVVSKFLGAGLSDKAKILGKINDNMAYSSNALQSAQGSLNKMATTLTGMLSVIAQSTGNSEENRKTLDAILQQKISQIALQTKSAEFDGRRLLEGDLGSSPGVEALFNTKAVSVKNLALTADFVKVAGTKGVNTITIGANTAAGEIVQFGGVKFKVVVNDPSAEGEFKLGSTVNETARNLAAAMINSKDEGLKAYTVSVSGADVQIRQLAADSTAIPVTGSANMTNAVSTPGTQGGLNLGGIKNIEDFINSPIAEFSLISQVESANGDNAAKILGTQFGNAEATGVVSANGDRAAAFRATIAGKEFTGAMFYANGGDMNDRILKMTHAPTGESFTIETHGVYGGGGDLDSAVNAGIIATRLTKLFEQSRLNQTRVLDVSTDKGDIFNSTGTKVASMNGVSVSMTSTSFLNKKFTDFKVELVGNDVKFTAFVEGPSGKQEFTNTITAANIPTLVKGYKLDLTDALSQDVLSINLGEAGLSSVSDVKNHDVIQQAFKDSLMNVGAGLDVRAGLAFDDILNVNINDVSKPKLFVDNSGKHIANLSIVDESDAKVAQEVVENALAYIRATQANVQTQIESVREASEALQSVIDITQSSADSYLKADLIEQSQEYSNAIKNILAAVSTIQAGNQISQAAQQLLQQL